MTDSSPVPPIESGFEQMSQARCGSPFSIQIAIALCLPSTGTAVHSRLLFSLVPITKMDCTRTKNAYGALFAFTFLLLISKPPVEALGVNPLITKGN